MFNFWTCDAFACSLHSSTRNNVADWNWTTAWPERKLEGGNAQKLLHTQGLLQREVFTQRRFLHTESFTQEVFTLRSSCRQTSRIFYTQKFLHEEVFTQRVFYTQTRLHTEAFTQRSLFTEERLHTKAFTHSKLLHTQGLLHREAFTQRSFLHTKGFTHTQGLLHREVFTQRSFLHTDGFTQRSLYTKEIFAYRKFYSRSLCSKELLHTNV